MIQDTGVEEKSGALAGKRIAFGVCGGIGAVETVRVIRELRRHKAEIATFLTPSATRFITELSLAWATQGPVVREMGADVEHLETFDCAVVAPLTLNTLTKCALGIADNPVSLVVANQLGEGRPVVLVPAMNLRMTRHPLYEQYRRRLTDWGAIFFDSAHAEGRMKMPAPEIFAEWLIGKLQ